MPAASSGGPLTYRPRAADCASRSVSVELTASVCFEMLEVLGQSRPSHWTRIWPASIALSRWLLEQAPGSLPASATELGCGMGLVSMTLAHLGLLTQGTDREPLAVDFACRNAERNGLVGFTGAVLDWSEPNGDTTTLLLASDIIYEIEAPQRLFELIDTAGLLSPGGRLVLTVPDARTMLVDEFTATLRRANYRHDTHVRHVEWEGQYENINVHVLQRPS